METLKEKIHNRADLGYICFKTKSNIYFIFQRCVHYHKYIHF